MPLLQIENVDKYYGSKGNLTKALKNVSFEVEKGEFLGIMGASGSGKTTLLNAIATIHRVTAGHIYLDGADITQLKSKELAKFRMEKLGIQDVLSKMPSEVSGGQRQRCACARAMINKPSLILADEPTGALDSHSAQMLLESFESLNHDQAATILAVQQLSDASKYRYRYQVLSKLGVEESRIGNLIWKQIGIYFLFPICIPVLVSIFLSEEIHRLIMKSMLTVNTLILAILLSLGLFALIYCIYFAATYLGYKRKVVEVL